MNIKILSTKENPLLKRKEVRFQVGHGDTGSTPHRFEVRKAVAGALKVNEDTVFVKKMETRTGRHMAVGLANVYDSFEQATVVEPEYIVKRNAPPEKEADEAKKG